MRLPKGRFANKPGPVSPPMEECRAHGVRPDFYDPTGEKYGLPTYRFHLAPQGFATRRQLRKQNLCPGGKPIQAQIIWKHGGRRKDGRGSSTRRVAYLYAVEDAKPKRVPSETQLAALEKAKAVRRTCPTCGIEQDYYIPRSKGECNRCSDPELYASGEPDLGADTGWSDEWADADWDPEQMQREPVAEMADLEAS